MKIRSPIEHGPVGGILSVAEVQVVEYLEGELLVDALHGSASVWVILALALQWRLGRRGLFCVARAARRLQAAALQFGSHRVVDGETLNGRTRKRAQVGVGRGEMSVATCNGACVFSIVCLFLLRPHRQGRPSNKRRGLGHTTKLVCCGCTVRPPSN